MALPRQALRGLLVLLWVLAIIGILWPTALLAEAAAVILVVYLAIVAVRARRRALLFAGVLGALSLAVCLLYGSWGGVGEGLAFAHLITALLPTLLVIRAAFEQSVEMARSRRRLAHAAPRNADSVLQTAGYALASVLTLGSVAVLSPLVAADASEPARVSAAQSVLRGTLIAVLWSPFFVSMAVVTHHLPWVPLWQIIPIGLVLSALGLLLSLLVFDPARSPMAAVKALGRLSPIALPVVAMATTVVGVSVLTGLGTIRTIILVLPPIALGWLMLGQTRRLRHVGDTIWRGLGGFGAELLVLAAAIILGQVIERTPAISAAVTPILATGFGAPGLLALVLAAMIGGGLVGVHPMATAPILLGLLAGLADHLSNLALALAVLAGWGLGNMVSISSVALATTAEMFSVPVERLVFGRNLAFVCAFAVVLTGVLSLLDQIVRG